MTRPAHNGSAGRVLVVEDDEGIREMLKYNLATAGFSVHEARDGASGLRTARTSRPDLILLDLMLPGMSGFDFCRALRKSSRVPRGATAFSAKCQRARLSTAGSQLRHRPVVRHCGAIRRCLWARPSP